MFCTVLTDMQTLPSHSQCTLFKFLLAVSRQRISGLIYEDGCSINIVVVVSNVSPVLSMKRVADSRRRRGVKGISGLINEESGGIHIVLVVSNISSVLYMKKVADSRRRGGVKHISGLIYEESGGIHIVVVVSNVSLVLKGMSSPCFVPS